jgi:hypothetical protein
MSAPKRAKKAYNYRLLNAVTNYLEDSQHEAIPSVPPSLLYNVTSCDNDIEPSLQAQSLEFSLTKPNSDIDNSEDEALDPALSSTQPPDSSVHPSDSISQVTNTKNKSSFIWPYFNTALLDRTFEKKGVIYTEKLYTCKLPSCTWSVYKSKRNGTSNLIGHLRKDHGIKKPSSPSQEPKHQSTIIDLLTTPKIQLSLEQAIVEWIVDDMQAFTVVERPSFRRIFEVLHKSIPASVRTGDSVRNYLLAKYKCYQLALIEELQANCSTISFTLDGWTSQNGHPIFAIIGHWITSGFVYCARVLDFVELQGMN